MQTLTPPPAPLPSDPPPPAPAGPGLVIGRIVTALLVVSPLVALGVAVPLLWGDLIGPRELVLAAGFYLLSAVGVTVGFHRMLTHHSFHSARWLKITLAAAGSTAFEGGVIGWVAAHRRHHRFSDAPGDPHSPHRYGTGAGAQLRGFLWAHVGWLFASDGTSASRYAPDLLRDRDIVLASNLFPVFAVLSLAIPFGIGWAITGTFTAAITALIWAGFVRMALFHHVTARVPPLAEMSGT